MKNIYTPKDFKKSGILNHEEVIQDWEAALERGIPKETRESFRKCIEACKIETQPHSLKTMGEIRDIQNVFGAIPTYIDYHIQGGSTEEMFIKTLYEDYHKKYDFSEKDIFPTAKQYFEEYEKRKITLHIHAAKTFSFLEENFKELNERYQKISLSDQKALKEFIVFNREKYTVFQNLIKDNSFTISLQTFQRNR